MTIKDKIFSLTIFSSIISLVYVFFVYYGVFRYLKLRSQKPPNIKSLIVNSHNNHGPSIISEPLLQHQLSETTKEIIEGYSKLQSISSSYKIKDKVALSFVVRDLTKEFPSILSLYDQTVKMDSVYAIHKTEYNIHDTIMNQLAVITPCGIDYGNMSKCLVSLIKEKDKNTLIISVNLDKIYGKDYLNEIYNLHKQNKDTLIYNENFIAIKPNMIKSGINYDDIPASCTNAYDVNWLLKQVNKSKYIDTVDSDHCFNI